MVYRVDGVHGSRHVFEEGQFEYENHRSKKLYNKNVLLPVSPFELYESPGYAPHIYIQPSINYTQLVHIRHIRQLSTSSPPGSSFDCNLLCQHKLTAPQSISIPSLSLIYLRRGRRILAKMQCKLKLRTMRLTNISSLLSIAGVKSRLLILSFLRWSPSVWSKMAFPVISQISRMYDAM